MDNYEQLKKLFKCGRYECDLFFYSEMSTLLQDLSLYELLPPVNHNKQVVQKVEALTKEHLRLLENEDDEDEALRVIKKIKLNVAQIDPKPIAGIMEKIESMGGKGYEQRIILLIKSAQFKKPYLEICERIMNSVHDQAVRFRDFLVLGMFFSKNGEKLNKFIDILRTVLENAVKELKKFHEKKAFIDAHPEIAEHQKVINYLKGTPILFKKVCRFNEIYRVLSGDNKFGLKISTMKKEIEEREEEGNRYTSINCEKFKQALVRGDNFGGVCSLCLEEAQADHKECLGALKLMYTRNQ